MDDIWERNGRKGPSLDRRSLLAAGATVPFVGVPAMAASPTLGAYAIDWADFLARHDLLWDRLPRTWRSEEHTSELQSLMRISYAVFCLKKKKKRIQSKTTDKPQLQLGYKRQNI